MNDVNIKLNEEGTSLQVSGVLNFEDIVELRHLGDQLLSRQTQPVVSIDLQGVQRCDNSGLVLLVAWMRDARRLGKKVVYLHVPGFLTNMAKVFGLQSILFNQ